jgi:hypothetical protein
VSYDDRIRLTQGADESYFSNANCSAADPLVLAILTLKKDINDADPGVIQKKPTSSFVSGVGQITDTGTTDGTAVIRFDFTAAQLAALAPMQYVFDVKLKTTAGLFFPGAQGRCDLIQQTTTSTS